MHHVAGEAGESYRQGGIAIVLDTPNFYDAKAGRPLAPTSAAGKLTAELLAAAGMSRADLFITDSVRCHTKRLRDYPEAVSNCSTWTTEEFQLYQPKVLVLMGATAIKSVFGTDATVGGSRGTFSSTPAKHPWGWRTVVCTYHPSAAAFDGGLDSDTGRMIVADLLSAKRAAVLLDGVELPKPAEHASPAQLRAILDELKAEHDAEVAYV